jgi:hypothetical protein
MAGLCAVIITHPIEVVKVRIQMVGELQKKTGRTPMLSKSWEIITKEGIRKGLYSGLSASMLRQVVYTGLRFGMYSKVAATISPSGRLSLFQRVVASLITGGLAAFMANPLDIVLVRMQADGRLPEHLRRKYKNVFHGLYKIITTEGLTNLYKGASPNIMRGCCVNAGQITGYDTSKLWLRDHGFQDNLRTHFVASMCAGLLTSIIACPADLLRTRYMSGKSHGVGGNVTYSSVGDAIIKIFRTEGIRGFYKGWAAYYARVGPHVLSLFIFFEQSNRFLDFLRSKKL